LNLPTKELESPRAMQSNGQGRYKWERRANSTQKEVTREFCIRVGLILSSSIKQCSSTKMEDEERFLGRGWVGGGSSEGITSTQPLCLLHKCNKIQRSILMDQKLQSGRDCDRH